MTAADKQALIARIRQNLPSQLLQLQVWLLWELVQKKPGEKPDKVPIYATDKNRAKGITLDSPEDRAQLVDFESAAFALLKVSRASGLGIALGEVPGEEIRLSGIDVDDCLDVGALDERAMQLLLAANSYAEKSPSGTGLHILGVGAIGTTKKDAAGLEIYDARRFFTVTGDALNGAALNDIADAAAFARKIYGANGAGAETAPAAPSGDAKHGKGGRNKFLSRAAYWMRVGGVTVEQIHTALAALNKAWCKPPLDDTEVQQIAARKKGVAAAAEPASSGAAVAADEDEEPWPIDPANLLGEWIPAPLSAADVPEAIGAYAKLYAARTGFDLTLPLAMMVGACAAAITDDIQICADSHTRWFQQPRLWTLVVAPPGEGKTPAFKEAIGPLRDLHHELTEQWKKGHAQWLKDCAECDEDEKPPKPPQPRVVVDDATLEKLSDVLVDNPRGVLVVTDEFSTWLGAHDLYRSKGGMDHDRGEWLRLFDGGPHAIERVKRGTVYVPNWGASIITATTPAALNKLAKHLPEDGLIQRFLTVICRDRVEGDDSITGIEAARAKYTDTLRRLYALRPRAHHGVVPLSLASHERFGAWNKDITKLLRATRDSSPSLAGHIAKYPTFCLRVALVFHCAHIVCLSDERARDPAAYPVPVETLDMALRYMRRAQQHAFALYLSRLGSEAYALAQDIARFVLARGEENAAGVRRRDLVQRVHDFRAAEDWLQNAALRLLVDAGWLRVDGAAGYSKAHATRFLVNPHLPARFASLAERVRKNRAAMRAAITEAAEERRG